MDGTQLYLQEMTGTILGQLSETVTITDADPLCVMKPLIVYVNEAFTKLTGYSEA